MSLFVTVQTGWLGQGCLFTRRLLDLELVLRCADGDRGTPGPRADPRQLEPWIQHILVMPCSPVYYKGFVFDG